MFYSFLWSGKGDKTKQDVMISDYKNGVLRMIDIKCFNKALKSSWVKKYLDHENYGKWKLFLITNCTNSVGLMSLRVTLIKTIWQNSFTYVTPSQQKFKKSGRKPVMSIAWTPSTIFFPCLFDTIHILKSEINQYTTNHGLPKEFKP